MTQSFSAGPPSKIALITGATKGIGHHLAVGFARRGIQVALVARTESALSEVVDDIRAAGGTATFVSCDVTDYAQVSAAVNDVQRQLGSVDVLVNNAGVIDDEVPVWQADPADFAHVMNVNTVGAFNVTHALLQSMIERRSGRIINMSSGAALKNSATYPGYFASKTALYRLGSSLADAAREHSIAVFEMSPGVVDTEMTRSMPVHKDRREWTDPADVVSLAAALADGKLDAWSGRFVRAGVDTVEALQRRAAVGDLDDARQLVLQPYGVDDPIQ